MDYRLILSILLIIHFLSDFYFQPTEKETRCDAKKDNLKKSRTGKTIRWIVAKTNTPSWKTAIYIVLHSVITTVMFCVLFQHIAWLLPLLTIATHATINIGAKRISSTASTKKQQTKSFLIEQLLHLFSLVFITYIFVNNNQIVLSPFSYHLRDVFVNLQTPLSPRQFVNIVCIFLFVGKPAGSLISIILNTVRKKQSPLFGTNKKKETITGEIGEKTIRLQINKEENHDLNNELNGAEQKSGRYIGILERYITVVFFLLNQYTAIAFTLTAKSVARFKELENSDFAEQYLIGTLSSQLLAILSVLILY